MTAARMGGRADTQWIDQHFRGDRRMWLKPAHLSQLGWESFQALTQMLLRLRQPLQQAGYDVSGPVSFQLACYPVSLFLEVLQLAALRDFNCARHFVSSDFCHQKDLKDVNCELIVTVLLTTHLFVRRDVSHRSVFCGSSAIAPMEAQSTCSASSVHFYTDRLSSNRQNCRVKAPTGTRDTKNAVT